jgi:hypothetical protein
VTWLTISPRCVWTGADQQCDRLARAGLTAALAAWVAAYVTGAY